MKRYGVLSILSAIYQVIGKNYNPEVFCNLNIRLLDAKAYTDNEPKVDQRKIMAYFRHMSPGNQFLYLYEAKRGYVAMVVHT